MRFVSAVFCFLTAMPLVAQVSYTPIGSGTLDPNDDGLLGLAIASDGTAYVSTAGNQLLVDVNLTSVGFSSSKETACCIRDLSIDPTTGILWGIGSGNNDNNLLWSIDPSDGSHTEIGSLGILTPDPGDPGAGIGDIASIAFSPEGTLFYVQKNGAGWGTINLGTGARTELGIPKDTSDRAYGTISLGWVNGGLVGQDCCQSGVAKDFFSLDPSTGVVTNLGPATGSQLMHDIAVYGGLVYGVIGGVGQGLDDAGTIGVLGIVAKQAQTITFDSPGDQTVGVPVTLTATASSGLPVNFSSNNLSVCDLNAGVLTPLAEGACTISADQVGDAQWQAAPTVDHRINVVAAPASANDMPSVPVPTLPAILLMAMSGLLALFGFYRVRASKQSLVSGSGTSREPILKSQPPAL